MPTLLFVIIVCVVFFGLVWHDRPSKRP